jgi:hypothetical protein
MKDVRKDIVFRDGGYRPLFTIKDGDSIKVTVAYDGEEVIRKCRWIDEVHLTVGSSSYHIDEFVQRMEKVGNQYEPAPKQARTIDILAAKYGGELKDVCVPMTEAAIKRLVGGSYEVETLYNWDKQYVFGAAVRGKDGIAVCGIAGDTLTSLHPYHAQSYKRELSTQPPDKKASLLGRIDKGREKSAAQSDADNRGGKSKKPTGIEV